MDKFLLLQKYFQKMSNNFVPLSISEACLDNEIKNFKNGLIDMSINDLKKIIKTCNKNLLASRSTKKRRKKKKKSKKV